MNEIKKYTIEDYRQWKTYKNDLEEGKKKWLLAGWKLKQIKDTKAYIEDGCKDFNEFITREKIGKSTAYSLIGIVEYFQLSESNALDSFDLSFHRAQKILPVVKSNPKKKDEIIELARTIESEKELMEELRIYRKQPAHKTIEIEKYVITSIPEDIKLIREGLQRLAQVENKTEVEILIDLIQERLQRDKNQIKEQEQKINKQAKTFADLFCEKYKKYYQSKYMFQGAKDMQLVKKITQNFTMEELEKALDKFFTAKGKDKWWKGAPTIGIFYSSINDWTSEEVKQKDKYDSIMEQAMKEAEQDN